MGYLNETFMIQDIKQTLNQVGPPEIFNIFDTDQIEEKDIDFGSLAEIKWFAFINGSPTVQVNYYTSVATIGFAKKIKTVNYLPFQYKFAFQKPNTRPQGYNMAGSTVPTVLKFQDAFALSLGVINDAITKFFLTGTVGSEKDGNQKKLDDMYGLLNSPDQVNKEVEAANKNNLNKIYEKIQEGLDDLQLGNAFRSPFAMIVDDKFLKKLKTPYQTTQGQPLLMSWERYIIETLNGNNGNSGAFIYPTTLIKNKIIIFPLNKDVIKFNLSKSTMPHLNEHVHLGPSRVAHGYIDFALGGLVVNAKSVVIVTIKTA